MRYLASVAMLSALLVSACGQTSKEESHTDKSNTGSSEAAPVPTGEPITLHARLDFMDAMASPSIGASRKLNTSIYLETDVLREGSGSTATYTLENEVTRVQGSLLASGSVAFHDSEVASSETYNMQNAWAALTANPEGKYQIKLPEASLIGEGLSVGVEIEVPVSGVKKATISSNGQSMESDVTHSRSMFCSAQSPEKDVCKLEFTIDAVPTKAQGDMHESIFENAKKLYELQGKKGPDGGLIMYSGMVPVFGATTQYHDGHFVTALDQQFSESVDGGNISQHIHLVVWSTARGDKWQPDDLPPLQK